MKVTRRNLFRSFLPQQQRPLTGLFLERSTAAHGLHQWSLLTRAPLGLLVRLDSWKARSGELIYWPKVDLELALFS